MNTVIFGANGPTGRQLVAQALEHGHAVTAAVRTPEAFDIEHSRLTVVKADVLDPAQVDAVIAGADAVLSSLGLPFGRQPIEIYSKGTGNIVSAMTKHDVRRLLVTSSSAADPAVRFKNSGGGLLLEAFKPIVIFTMGRTTYADMRRMESLVETSGLDWTIVRPSGLFEADRVTDYLTADDHLRGAFTSRIDLANFMVTALDDDSWVGRKVAIATSDGAPKALEFIRSQGSN